MRHALNCISWTAAMVAALLTAVMGSWQDISVPNLALRCLVAGLVILAFLRGGGELVWRAVLRSLAEHQVRQDEERRVSRRRRSEEREARMTEMNDSARDSSGAAQGQEAGFSRRDQRDEAVPGEKASTDRMAA